LTIMGLLKKSEVESDDSQNGDGLSIRPRSPAAKCGITESLLRQVVREEVRTQVREAFAEHQAKTQRSWVQYFFEKLRNLKGGFQ